MTTGGGVLIDMKHYIKINNVAKYNHQGIDILQASITDTSIL